MSRIVRSREGHWRGRAGLGQFEVVLGQMECEKLLLVLFNFLRLSPRAEPYAASAASCQTGPF